MSRRGGGNQASATMFGGNFRNTGIGGLSVMGNGKICAAPGYELVISRYERSDRMGK